MLKKILLVAVVAVALLVGVSYLLPRQVTVTHTAQLASSPDMLFPLVSTPQEWVQWSPWNARDTGMVVTFSGPATGVGARFDWTNSLEGDGHIVFTQSIPSVKVAYEMALDDWGPPALGDMQLAPNAKGTVVAWTTTFDMGNSPLGRWIGLMVPARARADFTEGLTRLDAYAQTLPPPEPIIGRELPGAFAAPSGPPIVP